MHINSFRLQSMPAAITMWAIIGILGVEKKDQEFYQVTLGGKGYHKARLGELIGPAVSESECGGSIERIVDTYLDLREAPGDLIARVQRLGLDPFKERAYAAG